MKVVILAGGEGKRMKPIQTYKCRLKFLGKELILHKIETLEKAGLKDLVIVCNPKGLDRIKEITGKKYAYVVQEKPRGMADAILSAKEFLKGEEVIITNAEDIVEKEAYENLMKKDCDSCLVGKKVKDYFPGGYFKMEGEKIVGIAEKPEPGTEPSNLVSIGIYLHRKFDKLVEYMKKAETNKDDQYEVAMDNMMKDGFVFKAAGYDDIWIPIKFPFHIFRIQEYFLSKIKRKISKNAKISDKAVVEGNIIIEDGVKVFENAVIKGPCYIGKNSIIANNCLVRESMISENCIVGFGSEVARSYVSDNTMIHMSYAGDSIIMDNCNLGAGTVTANWRFDAKEIKINVGENKIGTGSDKFGCVIGENCKTGINVSIMPGVKVGPNSKVGPHVLLTKDLGEGETVLLKQEHEVREK